MLRSKQELSILDHGLTFEGTLKCSGKLIIKGEIKGKIEAEELIVAKGGCVIGEVRAKRLTIGGEFSGEAMSASTTMILDTGNLSGRIRCRGLLMEKGGILNAEVNCLLTQKMIVSEKTAQKEDISGLTVGLVTE
ncbi:polymer-forming cytoskeletal protein [Desulfobacterales bacterium HSG17]|nr:polymer-forming cytoskeletal protein [Desulfobacterales bacterium HSG17]